MGGDFMLGRILKELKEDKLTQINIQDLKLIDYTKPTQTNEVINPHTKSLLAFQVLSNNKLATAGKDGNLYIRELNNKQLSKPIVILKYPDYFVSLALDSNNNLIALTYDREIYLIDYQMEQYKKYKLNKHTDYTYSALEISPGILATASCDCTIQLWDISDGKHIQALAGHKDRIDALAKLSANRFASGSFGGEIKIWSSTTYQVEQTLKVKEGNARSSSKIIRLLTLSNGWLASGANDGTIEIWDIETKRCLFQLMGHQDTILALSEFQEGILASGSRDNTIRIWDVYNGYCLAELKDHKSSVVSLSALPDGCLISGAGSLIATPVDTSIRVWEFSKLRTIEKQVIKTLFWSLQENTSVIKLKFNDCNLGDNLVEELVSLFNKKQNLLELDLTGNSITDRGTRILSGIISRNPNLEKIDLEMVSDVVNIQEQLKNNIPALSVKKLGLGEVQSDIDNLQIDCLDFSQYLTESYSDHQVIQGFWKSTYALAVFPPYYLAAQWEHYAIGIFDMRFGQCTATLKGHTSLIWALLALSENQLVSASADKTIRLWDLNTRECKKTFNPDTKVWTLVKLDNHHFASGGQDGLIKIWNINSVPDQNACIKILVEHQGNKVTSLAFWQGYNLMASGSVDGTILIWDMADFQKPKLLHTFSDPGTICRLEALKNGLLASCSYNRSFIQIWDIINHVEKKSLYGHHTSPVYTLKLLQSGLLASGGADKKIMIWDIDRECYLTSLTGHTNTVYALEEFSNGTLVSSSEPSNFSAKDSTIRLWQCIPRVLQFSDIEPWIRGLQNKPHIKQLILDNFDMFGHDDLVQLLSILEENLNLTKISLKNTSLDLNQAKQILAWKNQQQVKRQFNISDNFNVDDELIEECSQVTINSSEKDSEELKIQISEDNKVSIYVWVPRIKQIITEGEIGHVALQTYGKNSVYVSFWPEKAVTINNFFKPVAPKFIRTLNDEKRKPHYEFHFYSLNVNIINNLFHAFEKSKYNWSLLGSTFLASLESRNCCSLVLFLLQKAGIGELLKSYITYRKRMAEIGEEVGHYINIMGASARLGAHLLSPDSLPGKAFIRYVANKMPGPTAFMDMSGRMIGWLVGVVPDLAEGIVLTPKQMVTILQYAKKDEQTLINKQNELNEILRVR
jgi:WD40 repeat protein